MDIGCERIRCLLEETYDIPFSVSKIPEHGEPKYIIGPNDPSKELFTVHVSFRNRVRLTMEFVPQKYSANFISGMGNQPEEDKTLFAAYAGLLSEKQAKGEVLVNGTAIDLADTSSWPSSWQTLAIRYTKMPVSIETQNDYAELALEWGSLLVGMILSLTEIVSIEPEDAAEGFAEGSEKSILSKRYERNPLNRKLCLAAKGYDCAICGFNFEKHYGELGKGFIHVHHIVPVSQIGPGYIINPIRDLIPVCPNCHAMLHRSDPPISPNALQNVWRTC